MYDKDLAKEILSKILKALDTVIYRFAPVKSLADVLRLTAFSVCSRHFSCPPKNINVVCGEKMLTTFRTLLREVGGTP